VIASIRALFMYLPRAIGRLRSARGRVPRTHPFGWGRSCDGCDRPGEWPRYSNGGHYCEDCGAYVAETTGALPLPPPMPIRRDD
jgi:hypothetical protein